MYLYNCNNRCRIQLNNGVSFFIFLSMTILFLLNHSGIEDVNESFILLLHVTSSITSPECRVLLKIYKQIYPIQSKSIDAIVKESKLVELISAAGFREIRGPGLYRTRVERPPGVARTLCKQKAPGMGGTGFTVDPRGSREIGEITMAGK